MEFCIINRRYFDIARGLHENCKYPHLPDDKLKSYLLKNYNEAVQQEDESDNDSVLPVVPKRKRGLRSVPPATPPHTPEVTTSRATTKPNTKIKVSAKKTAADETPAPKANKSVAVTVPASLEKAVDVVAKMQAYEDALEERDGHIKQLKSDMSSMKEMIGEMIVLNKAAASTNTPAVIQPSSQVSTLEHQLSNFFPANTSTPTPAHSSFSTNASDIMSLLYKQDAERSKASLHLMQMEFLLRR